MVELVSLLMLLLKKKKGKKERNSLSVKLRDDCIKYSYVVPFEWVYGLL